MLNELIERCCGLDVHSKSITACVLTPESPEAQIKAFGTMTADLVELVDWLKKNRCTHVAMESTGVYWKPVYNILEAENIETLVVNAKHIKNVPGRKTDINDAQWIANLLRHGLLKGSNIPDRERRELRELSRYRKSLVNTRASEVNRMQKVLEGANIKLGETISSIMCKSGREMIEALIKDGSEPVDPKVIATLARGRMKGKQLQIARSLEGTIGEHQKLMLRTQLENIDQITQSIEKIEAEIDHRLDPFVTTLELLETIPGIGKRTAQDILAEIGTEMEKFPSAEHLASWAGMTPGNNESAGRKKSSRTRKGNKYLRSALTEAARAAARTKNTYLSSQYGRIAARRGKNRAAIAVGHSILVIMYHIIRNQTPYYELGGDYFDKQKESSVVRNSVKRLEALGYHVEVTKDVPA